MMKKHTYKCPSDLMFRTIRVAVVGVGGTGGEVIDALTRLHAGLKALGHQEGLHVTAFDDDTVEIHNVGRQRFSESDIGLHKSISLIQRVNFFYDLTWEANPFHFDPLEERLQDFDLIIGCTDLAKFRVDLAERGSHYKGKSSTILWLDFGNGQHSGQCVLGHLSTGINDNIRLPHVVDLYPSLKDTESFDKEDKTPRCSLAEALKSQDLFINSAMVKMGMNILWQLFTDGQITAHGMTIDVRSLKSNPIEIDEDVWQFMGGYDSDIIPFNEAS